jgi:hypothetical protein
VLEVLRPPSSSGGRQYHHGMPMAEILDGPPEWAGTQFERPEEDLALRSA